MQYSPSSLMALLCKSPCCFLSPLFILHFPKRCLLFLPKYGSIHWCTFKPLGRSCIPFHSIPQTVEAGSAGCLGTNRMKRNAVFTL
ncbi:hypothetical protein XELAEV_18001667mg [Xenopus laevis]|uniref:Uncharacterized protein n=1 Tax=Xenopus laevis TaxID=8355 RepID=A0A974GYH1_XENLA|nr:hypothetical protein XELAEV_18001667mg [Xenopus laevis]